MRSMTIRMSALSLLLALGASLGLAAPEPMPPGLCRAARAGLEAVRARVPSAHVTSGRRTREDEARAWADNIARRRRWMRLLKAADRPELVAAQAWIDANWKTLRGKPEPIAIRLTEVFAGLPDADMARISPHFGGSALDLRKHPRLGRRLLTGLPHVRVVLDEGDHWHVDFHCDEPLDH